MDLDNPRLLQSDLEPEWKERIEAKTTRKINQSGEIEGQEIESIRYQM